jgi:hypothetical protein
MSELITGPKLYAKSGQRTLVCCGCEEADAAAMLVQRAFEQDAVEQLSLFVNVSETGFGSAGSKYWTPQLLQLIGEVPIEWSLDNLRG